MILFLVMGIIVVERCFLPASGGLNLFFMIDDWININGSVTEVGEPAGELLRSSNGELICVEPKINHNLSSRGMSLIVGPE